MYKILLFVCSDFFFIMNENTMYISCGLSLSVVFVTPIVSFQTENSLGNGKHSIATHGSLGYE